MKTIDEIYQEMAAQVALETGVAPAGNSEMAVRLYALAAQIYGLYEENAWTCRQCFPQTATGEELEKHGFLRGITRLPAQRAAGDAALFPADGGGGGPGHPPGDGVPVGRRGPL